MRRRLRFAVVVLISQVLLIAVTVAWLIHMTIIAVNGSVSFVERNPYILWGELIATVLITVFAIYVLALQIKRLGERRRVDRNGGSSRVAPPINNVAARTRDHGD